MSDGLSPLWSGRYVLLHLHQQAFLGFCENTPWFANGGGKKKRDGSRLDNIKLARFAELGKNPRLKLGFSAWTTMASLGPWSYCSLPEKKSTKLLKAIQRSPICGAEYAPQAQKLAWDASLPKGTAGSKVFWSTTVSHIPQYREGKRSMLGASPKAGHCMALSWQVNHLSHTARCHISSLSCSANQSWLEEEVDYLLVTNQ